MMSHYLKIKTKGLISAGPVKTHLPPPDTHTLQQCSCIIHSLDSAGSFVALLVVELHTVFGVVMGRDGYLILVASG
jgi:hypothetical protein